MTVHPNVKVNLGLSVLRKREDGFHDIDTVFVPCMEICDTLEVITGDDYSRTSASLFARYGEDVTQGISEDGKLMITIAREGGIDWDPLSDLCAKAYFILAEDFDLPPVKVFLEKKAPVGAGLGGGSSDAAFTLKCLNGLAGLGLSKDRLASYAARLGSDCAFFIYNRPMRGTGRGEILDDIDLNLNGYDLKVIVPDGISVSTKEAYGGIVPRENPAFRLPENMEDVPLTEALRHPVEDWKHLVYNDFETTVFNRHPQLAAIKQSLYESGALYASMSGSGSALFGIYER